MGSPFRLLILGLLAFGPAHGQDQMHSLRPATAQRVLELVQEHPSLLGLRVTVNLGQVRSPEADCGQPPSVSFSGRSVRPWGRFNVVVQCSSPTWTLRVPVQTRVFGSIVVASRALTAGTVLGKDDLALVDQEITKAPVDMIRSLDRALGREISKAVPQGAPVGLNKFRIRAVIKKGDKVLVSIKGMGFQASGEGTALGPGQEGDTIEIRMVNGQVVRAEVIKSGQAQLVMN